MFEYLLAVYGITHYLVHTDGPKQIFFRLRRATGMRMGARIEGVVYFEDALSSEELAEVHLQQFSNGSFWADVLECHKCTAFYVALLLLPLLIFRDTVAAWAVLMLFAAVGATIVLHEIGGQ